jgi:hypothetical protein
MDALRRADLKVKMSDRKRLLGDVLGKLVGEVGRIGKQDLVDTGHLGGRLGCGRARAACHQYGNGAAAEDCRSNGVERGNFEGVVIVFGDD